jgi:hypothetical protein
MTVSIDLNVHFPPDARMLAVFARIERALADLKNQGENTMSQISDWAAKEATALASIHTGITALDTLIQNFQSSPGTLSAADQAALDSIAATSASLATAANTIPAPPVAVAAPAVTS